MEIEQSNIHLESENDNVFIENYQWTKLIKNYHQWAREYSREGSCLACGDQV